MWFWFSLQSRPERRNTVFVVSSQRLGEASIRRKRSVYYWWSLSYVNWVDWRSTAVSGECIARRMGYQIWLRLRANTRPPNKARKPFWRQLWADSILKKERLFCLPFLLVHWDMLEVTKQKCFSFLQAGSVPMIHPHRKEVLAFRTALHYLNAWNRLLLLQQGA